MKAINNPAYFERIVRWQQRIDITQGLYVANPTDSIVGADYLWGWQNTDYDDSNWKPAKYLDISSYRYHNISGMFYPDGWLLVERPIQNQIEKREEFPFLQLGWTNKNQIAEKFPYSCQSKNKYSNG
ncbi:MAG: hypothetical protein IPF54_00260 [Draconibacterium sp.]|nr:hypothetical protein [Draconibacterium sp.]